MIPETGTKTKWENLGVGDLGATRQAGTGLKTYALGSCVALMLLDPKTHCVSMAHVALPESSIGPERAKQYPGHFADTAVPALLQAMKRSGACGEHRRYIVKIVGGANVADPKNTFNIGKRNALAIRKALWAQGMGPSAEDIGGSLSRTVSLEVDTGIVFVSSPGRPDWRV
ncbi:MAG: chemotaxis protein CheD [Planctomycetota bacterium]|nr:MAG: chemotaxis protein CheD [Planctomycetota bacterium]